MLWKCSIFDEHYFRLHALLPLFFPFLSRKKKDQADFKGRLGYAKKRSVYLDLSVKNLSQKLLDQYLAYLYLSKYSFHTYASFKFSSFIFKWKMLHSLTVVPLWLFHVVLLNKFRDFPVRLSGLTSLFSNG